MRQYLLVPKNYSKLAVNLEKKHRHKNSPTTVRIFECFISGKLLIVSFIISVKEWLVFSTNVKSFPVDLNGLKIPLPIPA